MTIYLNNKSTEYKTHASENKNSVDDSKVKSILHRLTPLTLPYQDKTGNLLQIWKTDQYGMIGSVLDLEGKVKIVYKNNIVNPLSHHNQEADLLERLERISLRKWHIVFDSDSQKLTIWPLLMAAGTDKEDFYFRLEDVQRNTPTNREALANHSVYYRTKKVNANSNTQKLLKDAIKGCDTSRTVKEGAVIRYYAKETESTYQTSRGHSKVVEHNTETGDVKSWMEVYAKGEGYVVQRRHDKTENGKNLDVPHIPKTLKDMLKERDRLISKLFHETLQKTRLTDSYPGNVPPKAGSTGGSIGGVGLEVDLIEGLFDNEESFLETEHLFLLPLSEEGKAPFSDLELKQILRELAIGIFVHGEIPFFSLHFNQDADLYPVIHPVYDNTLVGQVISMLDYYMKGYLNGGVFKEKFVKDWDRNPQWWGGQKNSALADLIDLTSYCKENVKGEEHYFSLRSFISGLETNDVLYDLAKNISAMFIERDVKDASIFNDLTKFSNSFRIISKQKEIKKDGNLFTINADFDVHYTISPNEEYQEALNQYRKIHGDDPYTYKMLNAFYQIFSQRIHNHMVKLPFCREYFSMLGVINFFAGYFLTLKRHGKAPLLPTLYTKQKYSTPSLFPHLPVEKVRKESVTFNMRKIYSFFIDKHFEEFKSYLKGKKNLDSAKIIHEDFMKSYFLNRLTPPAARVIKKQMNDGNQFFLKLAEQTLIKLKFCYDEIISVNTKKLEEKNCSKEQIKEYFDSKKVCDELDGKIRIVFPALISSEDTTIPFEEMTSNLKSELTSKEVKEGMRIVGGCGLELKPLKATVSKLGGMILENYWHSIQQLTPESLLKIENKSENFPYRGALFKLEFADSMDEDYSWMESHLICSDEESDSFFKQELILQAISTGDKETFKKVLESAGDLNFIKDRQGRSWMHHAAMFKDTYFSEMLIKKGLWVSGKDYKGNQPIHYAAMCGHEEQVKLFLETSQVSVRDASNKNGMTPLIAAVQHNQEGIVKLLIKYYAQGHHRLKDGYAALHCALHHGYEGVAKILLETGHDVISGVNEETGEGITPLMLAAEIDSEELVKLLIKKGANPKAKSKEGLTALDIAVKKKCVPVIKLLIADNPLSNHTIEAIIESDSIDILKLFSQKKEFLEYQNLAKETPLIIAIKKGCIPAAFHIVEQTTTKGYLTTKDSLGESAVTLAIQGRYDELLKAIFDKETKKGKIEVNSKDILKRLCAAGYSPFLKEYFDKQINLTKEDLFELLVVAAVSGRHDVITELLIPKGVDIEDLKSPYGWRIEHYLAKSDGSALFQKQILKKASLLKPSKNGLPSLAYIAAANGSWRVFRFILRAMTKLGIAYDNHFKKRHLFYIVIERAEKTGLELFFEFNEDSNVVNQELDDHKTLPVHLAAKMGSKEMLELLYHKKADFDVRDALGKTPLIYAIRCMSPEAIMFLIDQCKVPINAEVIYEAALLKKEVILNSFVKIGANIDISSDNANTTALLMAVHSQHYKAFAKLLFHKANLDCINNEGWSPILLASSNGQVDILRMILAHTTPKESILLEGNNALHLACKNGHAACVRLLIEKGFSPKKLNGNNESPSELANHHQGVLAALGDNTEAYDKIVKQMEEELQEKDFLFKLTSDSLMGAKSALVDLPINEIIFINYQGKWIGGTPLHLALHLRKNDSHHGFLDFFFKNKEQLDLSKVDSEGQRYEHQMVLAGVNPFKWIKIEKLELNRKGQTILHLAASSEKYELFQALLNDSKESLNLSEELNRADHQGRTPIFYAIKANNEKTIQLLIEQGVDLQHRDHALMSPLFFACQRQQESTVRALLAYGADIRQRGTFANITPVEMCLRLKYQELSLFLLFKDTSYEMITSNDTLAHVAAQEGNLPMLRLLVSRKMSLQVPNNNGFQPIHYAAIKGQTSAIKFLAEEGVLIDTPVKIKKNIKDINTKDDINYEEFEGATPLLLASMHGQIETTKYLLSKGADPKILTESGEGVLTSVRISDGKPRLDLFNSYPLSDQLQYVFPSIVNAVRLDDVSYLKLIYARGISVDAEILNESTGLHVASRAGALNATQFFLEKGAYGLYPDRFGQTAFQLAAANESVEQFRLLLDYFNPDLSMVNNRKETLLYIATKANNIQHVMLLIHYRASLDEQNVQGFTPLHIAAQSGFKEIFELLLACGADYTKKTIVYKKLPQAMCSEKNAKEFEQILNKYIDIKNNAKQNESRLQLAVRAEHTKAVMLLSHSSDVNDQDDEGSSALHEAVQIKNNALPIIKQLLKNGADIDLQNKKGMTPLCIACHEVKDVALTQFLFKAGAKSCVGDKDIIGELKETKFEGWEKILKIFEET
jgi:ankyrin repeat protein